MVTDKNGKELCIGDSVLYVRTTPRFSIRGKIVGFVTIENLLIADVELEFCNNEPIRNSIVRVRCSELMKYDAERTVFV